MATNIMESILKEMKQKYPDGGSIITLEFAEKIFHQLSQSLFNKYPKSKWKYIQKDIKNLQDRTLHGITAADFYRRVIRIASQENTDILNSEPNNKITRLEKEINDLRSIITTPLTIDTRLEELQEQVDELRDQRENNSSGEKKEDILQKYMKSTKKAFVIMPFNREFDNVWLGAIKTACSESNYAPLRADEISLSSLITDDIEKYTSAADVVIVDLTGNNPNVMFELGWSLAKNKKPIVLCQGEHASKVAFDVRGIRYISYENSWLGIEALKLKIKDYISTTEIQIPKKPIKKVNKKKTL